LSTSRIVDRTYSDRVLINISIIKFLKTNAHLFFKHVSYSFLNALFATRERESPWIQALATRRGAQAPCAKRAADDDVRCCCDEGSRFKEPSTRSVSSKEVHHSKGSTGCRLRSCRQILLHGRRSLYLLLRSLAFSCVGVVVGVLFGGLLLSLASLSLDCWCCHRCFRRWNTVSRASLSLACPSRLLCIEEFC
jgi:hypothetical protein